MYSKKILAALSITQNVKVSSEQNLFLFKSFDLTPGRLEIQFGAQVVHFENFGLNSSLLFRLEYGGAVLLADDIASLL